jgi:hypothetical protein
MATITERERSGEVLRSERIAGSILSKVLNTFDMVAYLITTFAIMVAVPVGDQPNLWAMVEAVQKGFGPAGQWRRPVRNRDGALGSDVDRYGSLGSLDRSDRGLVADCSRDHLCHWARPHQG